MIRIRRLIMKNKLIITVVSVLVLINGITIYNNLPKKPLEVQAEEIETVELDLGYQPEKEINKKPEDKPKLIYMGIYTSYAYCSCKKCCGKTDGITATGVKAKANHTVAVDPDLIPLGSTLIIDGKEYVAEDVGGSIKGCKVDIYFDSHKEALEYGKRDVEVYVKEVK